MIRTFALLALAPGLVCLLAAPALAQLDSLPRFDALDQQLQREEQRQADQAETARQQERMRTALPGSGVSAAERAMRDLAYQRERDQLLLKAEQDRARVQRERDLADAALPNTRVPAFSSAVVREPNAANLPPPPPGKYYARVQGRYVLVDAASELVEAVLPVRPTDPTADVPAGPRPLPDYSLPTRRVSPNSVLAIRDPAALALPAAPAGQFYAQVDGRIVLVDARTELPVKVVRAG